jgi:protocatechuate 3,4-dioxygenase beta subunit
MHDPTHEQGLARDIQFLEAMRRRRRALAWIAGLGAVGMIGCGGGGDDGPPQTAGSPAAGDGTGTASGSTAITTGGTVATCSTIPEETAGPYPGDGSNTANGTLANALALTGIVRSDIRTSVAGASGTAGGVPLVLTIRLVDTRSACADLSGYAIYLWHCDREGRYSMYSPGVTGENHLRGVQETGGDGTATFTTVFPGCYAGRMPHLHFEVYRNANTATAYSNKLRTSQIALPTEVCSAVYAGAPGYGASVANLARIGFASDNVFSDGVEAQLATVSGSIAAGYTATLVVGISI